MGGDYGGMVLGIVLFHTQHVFDEGSGGYIAGSSTANHVAPRKWQYAHAALLGSSCLVIHSPILRWCTLGIQYHHIHHLRTRIPGYKLREVHEAAPPDAWAGVAFLGARGVWRALQLQAYDEAAKRFVTYAEAERPLSAGMGKQAAMSWKGG